ncbi:MAG TPA: Gfo/Idh/MocA family oxidoreductase [Planctomycetota bacterium]|nr:Gfo/Idh/MocA family oxidoreductase [Planctomycetota bacterium]
MTQRSNRRQFLQNAGMGAAGFWIAGRQVGYGQEKSPNAQVSIACIGTGGQGGSDMGNVSKLGNIVGLCDIDDKRNDEAGAKFPKAKKYFDYRKMFDEMAKEIDCVTVGVPDNHHACASIMAMKLGKGVYTQKPLTHDIYEARQMTEVAAKYKVATQMGNQGSAGGNLRESVEIVQSGLIGDVKEVHLWTNRPIWPQSPNITARPKDTPPVPAHLHWDEWLGPAPERAYHSAYLHFKWRGWWDFGTGALGDMACHTTNLPYRALRLGAPTTVEAESEPINPETYPGWAKVTYEFPARGDMPACKVIWYEGKKNDVLVQPPVELYQGEKISGSGSLLVGSKGTLYSPDDYGGTSKWLPQEQFKDMKKPKPTLPRSPGHHAEWINAVKGGEPAFSNFAQAGPFTEFVLLGNLAMRLGKKFEWDSANLKAKNCPEADQWIKREYRKGWSL